LRLSLVVWWIALAIEALVLVRAFRGKLISRYVFFYAYISSVLIFDIARYVIYTARPTMYPEWYWLAQYVSLITGCGIILEIFKYVLSPYPGAERIATVGGLALFGIIFVFALVYPAVGPNWSPAEASYALERDLRTVQAMFLFGVLAIISYYGIVIGRNIRGMILGYGLYIGTSLVSLALRSYAGPPANALWTTVQPVSYVLSLMIWATTLWSYQPNPVRDPSVRLEADYEALAGRTRSVMRTMRSHLGKAVRQ